MPVLSAQRPNLPPPNPNIRPMSAFPFIRVLALVLAAAIAITGAFAAPDKPGRVELYHGIAQGNYLIGDLKGAAEAVDTMLDADPGYVPALTLRARIRLDQGDTKAALAAADRAIAEAPDEPRHRLLRALILGQSGQQDEALATIRSVLDSAEPDTPEARAANELLGTLRMRSGEWDAAAEAFDAMTLADSADAESTAPARVTDALLQKARESLGSGDAEAGLDAIGKALDYLAQHESGAALQRRTALRLMRARLLARLGRAGEAIANLQTITGRNPGHREALVTLASLYAAENRWDALDGLLEPVRKDPALRDIVLYLEGRAALARDRAGTARSKFTSALDALPEGGHPLRGPLHFHLARCHDRLGHRDRADRHMLKALDADYRPESVPDALRAARLLLRANAPDRAIPLLEALALNRLPPDAATTAEAWALLGRAHRASGDDALALSAFNQALEIRPHTAHIRALRGDLLRRLGDLPGAAADYEAALRLDPENPAPNYALGLVRLGQGNLKTAADHLAAAVPALPDDPGLRLLRALIAHARGQPEAARDALDAYLSRLDGPPSETAVKLGYCLTAPKNPTLALRHLEQHANRSGASADLGHFLAYAKGALSADAVLDYARAPEGTRPSPAQHCATAFWLAQHHLALGETKPARQLLKTATQTRLPDTPEYHLANHQRQNLPESP